MPQINGQQVGEIGYGLMGHTWVPKPPTEEQSFAALRAAVKGGATFWNGGEFYGTPEYNSMTLLERYFAKYPEDADKIVLSIKGGGDLATMMPNSSPEGIRRSIDNVIKQLNGRKKVDLFEVARRDTKVPLATTYEVIQKEYVDTGKIGGISLSEVSAATIHEIVKLVKVAAVEVELSMWSTDVLTNGVAAACAEHNIPLVAYSPLGRGFLVGQFKTPEDIPEGDFRKHMPRFQGENFYLNLELVTQVKKLAEKKNITPSQLAMSWVKALEKRPGMPKTIIPIPGATHEVRVKENVVYIDLSDEDMKEIDETLAKFEVKGGRYDDGHPIEG